MTESQARNPHLAVLDTGKTHIKLAVLDGAGRVVHEQRRPNTVLAGPPYPHYDLDGLWHWLLDALREAARTHAIDRIVTTTHGACAVLTDATGPVLPVLDYEHTGPESVSAEYDARRGDFAETGSPPLPAGLNLGRQLYWLQQQFPQAFARVTQLLMYPQFWAWKLCGVAAAEVTSLGCHTDLWNPAMNRPSQLLARQGWDRLLPPLQPAWSVLGTLKPELCAHTGLPARCEIISGIHDSNASLLPHLVSRDVRQPFTVISTGTWVIAAAIGSPLARLRAEQDMLANVDAYGRAVACARFMGGREFATLNTANARDCSEADLDTIIAQRSLALPAFADTGGPFSGRSGRIEGPAPATPGQHYALATLYCALVTDHCLDALGAKGDLVIEGSFVANAHYAALLAALRPQQPVFVSNDVAGTLGGARVLARWVEAHAVNNRPAQRHPHPQLAAYREQWRRWMI